MRILLDTHVFLWWIADRPELSGRAREIIADSANQLVLSAASGWEIAIKARLGRLQVPEALERFLTDQLVRNAIEVLPITMSHALRTYRLADLHRDPFDRLIVAQAIVEGIPVLTKDPQIGRYDVPILW